MDVRSQDDVPMSGYDNAQVIRNFYQFCQKTVNFRVLLLKHCLATSVSGCYMFLKVRQSQQYPNYGLGLLKSPFTTRSSEKWKNNAKNRG